MAANNIGSFESNEVSDPSTAAAPIDDAQWLSELVAILRARWWIIAAGAVLFFVLALIQLWCATYTYTAMLRVSATQTSGPRPGSGALGGLAALAGVGTGAGEAATPFKLYLEGLQSREIAARLSKDPELMHAVFARDWDKTNRRWRQPPSLGRSLRNGVFGMLGLPVYAWQPPGPAQMQDFLLNNIGIGQNTKTPLVTISMQWPDPVFAMKFLTALHDADDQFVREMARARTQSNVDYLSAKLDTVSVADFRAVIIDAIAQQAQQMMLVNSNAPYAADPFGGATASPFPTAPRPVPQLLAYTIAGTVLGAVAAVLLGIRDRRRQMRAAAAV